MQYKKKTQTHTDIPQMRIQSINLEFELKHIDIDTIEIHANKLHLKFSVGAGKGMIRCSSVVFDLQRNFHELM